MVYYMRTHEEHKTHINYFLDVQERHSERLFVNKRIQRCIIIDVTSIVESFLAYCRLYVSFKMLRL